MLHLARRFVLALIVSCLLLPFANAANAAQGARLSSTLGNLWETVLETPTPQNPFSPGGNTCVVLPGGILSPFGPEGAPLCSVDRGTKIFVAAWTFECSSFEGNGTTEAELRKCAVDANEGVSLVSVSVDGTPVAVTRVQTALLRVHLPKDNIFGLSGSARKGLSVGDGWVVLLNALSPGTHTIVIQHEGSGLPEVTTTIVVR